MSGISELRRFGVVTTDLLLGADRLPPDHRRSYQEFFLALVKQRGFPLHTASLWNALYFGWSVELDGYLGRGVRLSLAQSGRPIPVGAFVQVKLGQNRIALAEVVYKEGRDPGIHPLGFVAPAASGARLGLLRATEETPVCEALILDFDAFGEGLNDTDGVVLARAQRKKLLTEDQHLVVEARYPAADAGVDDLTLFARYVFEQYGEDLFGAYLRDGGAGVGLDERWELLLRSLQAADELAQTTPGLATFGLYHLDEADYQSDLRAGGDARFGGDAIRSIAGAAIEPAPVRRSARMDWKGPLRHTASYRATGALVHEHLDRYGLDPEEKALLTGPSYARLVLEVNHAIADRIGEDGSGAESKVHVRLDDEWQGGGVWRTVRYEDDPPPESRFAPLVPLGLGFAEQAAGAAPSPNGAELEPEREVAERTQRGWRVPLRLIDLHHRDLPLDSEALTMLAPDIDELIVEINDGIRPAIRKPRPLDRARRLVREMFWSPAFLPGVIVSYTVGHGGRMLSVRAFPLAVPVELEGRTLRWEFNERVFRRDLRLLPMEVPSGPRGRSLTELIAEAFRRRGRPTPDGGRALRSEEVVAVLLGSDHSLGASSPIVLRLQAGDYEFRDGEYVWFPRLSRRTSPRERVRLLAARTQSEPRLQRILAPRMVPMIVRTYVRGRMGRKHDSYAAALERYHMKNRLPETLLPNQTWVEPYELE